MAPQTKKSKTAIWFITGLLIGAALVWIAISGNMIPSNTESSNTAPSKTGIVDTNSIKSLSELKNIPAYVLDSAMFTIDSSFYRKCWHRLIEMPGYREMDSLFLDSIIRKTYFDSIMGYQRLQADTFVVQNDQLLETKSIKVIIQKSLFGSNDTSKANDYVYSEARYKIEFWESPIHYKGYKRSGNYVIVYGFDPETTLWWVQIDNQLYMKDKQVWHPLPATNEFAYFSNVSSAKLLNRLELALKRS